MRIRELLIKKQEMASFWPTPFAIENMPAVAEGMNNMPKIVFSRTLKQAAWNNTKLVIGNGNVLLCYEYAG